jgi:hypothetical protein
MFAPEMYYLTARAFAAGQVSFVVGYHGTADEQRRAIERWHHESVPFALMLDDAQHEAERFFPLVAGELHRRYVALPRTAFGMHGSSPLIVMVERSRQPASTYGPMRLPCFVNRRAPL